MAKKPVKEEKPEPQMVSLPLPLVNAVIQYLAQRPFGEVAHLIGGMGSFLPAPKNPEKLDKKG